MQAAGSWSVQACCAVHGNGCYSGDLSEPCDCSYDPPGCIDSTSSSDWLFGLWPGPPQRFKPTGTNTDYQWVEADFWPLWGGNDLSVGDSSTYPEGRHGTPGGECPHGDTYEEKRPETFCGDGGDGPWGATDVEVWYPR